MATVGSLVVRMAADVAPLETGLIQAGRRVDAFAARLRMIEGLMTQLAARTLAAGAAIQMLGAGAGTAGSNFQNVGRSAGAANSQFQAIGSSARIIDARFRAVGASASAAAGGGGIGGLPPALSAATGGMNNANNSAGGLIARLSSLRGFFRDAAAAAVGFAATVAAFRILNTVFATVGAAIDAVSSAVFGMNSTLEQANIAFTSMLNSGRMAGDMLDDLKEFAIATPFRFDDVVTGTQRLLAMGFAAQEVIPMMTALGNTAAALGMGNEVIQRLVLALGQMKTAGRVLGQELRQLYNANVNINQVFEVMAQQTGKTVAELQTMQREGVLAADLFIDAFQEWSNVRFGDMMEEQSRTFAGAWVRIVDTLRIVGADAFKPIFDAVRDLMVQFSEFARSDQFRAWGESINEWTTGAVRDFEVFISTHRETFIAIGEGVRSFGEDTLGTIGAIKDLAAEVGNLVAQLGLLQDLASTMGGIMSVIFPPAEDVQRIIRSVQGVVVALRALDAGLQGDFDKSDSILAQFLYGQSNPEEIIDNVDAIASRIQLLFGDSIIAGEGYANEQMALIQGLEHMTGEHIQTVADVNRIYTELRGTVIEEGTALEMYVDVQRQAIDTSGEMDDAYHRELEMLLLLNGGYGNLDTMLSEVNEGREDELVTLQDLYDLQLLEQNVIHNTSGAYGAAAIRMAELRQSQAEVTEQTGAFVAEGRRGVQMAHDLGVNVEELGRALTAVDHGPLIKDMKDLAGAYQGALHMVDIFTKQHDEYDDLNEQLKGAYDILNERREKGIELSQEELRFLEKYPERQGTFLRGMENATVQAGMWAGAAADVMIAQNELNVAIKDGVEDLTPYEDALEDAQGGLMDAAKNSGGFKSANELLVDTLLLHVIPALEGIQDILGRLDGTTAAPSVTLEELTAAGPGGGGFSGGVGGRIAGIAASLGALDDSTATITAVVDDHADDHAQVSLDRIQDKMQWLIANGSFTMHAYLDTTDFDAGLNHIAANTPRSPAKEGPLTFTPDWDWLFEGLEASAGKYTEATLKHLKNYVDTAKAIFDVLDAEIDFSIKFAEFQGGGGITPDMDALQPLHEFTEQVTRDIGESAALFEKEFLEQIKTYADAAKSGIDLLSAAVDLFEQLNDVNFDLDVAKTAASQLKFLTEHIVLSLGDSVAVIESGEGLDHPSVRGAGFVGAADAYAQGALSGVELIGAAIEALAGLADFESDMEMAKDAASNLKFLIEHIVLSIGDSAMVVNSEIDHPAARGEGFVGIAAAYAEGAQTAVALVGDALGFIASLADYEDQFDLDSAKRFASDLKFLIEHIVVSIGDSAALFNDDGNPALLAFEEAAGAALSIISDVADTLEIFTGKMDLSVLSGDEIKARARILGGLARAVADVMLIVADDFKDTADSIGELESAVSASFSIISDVTDALEIFTGELNLTALSGDEIKDIARVLGGYALIIAQVFREIAGDWPEQVDPAVEEFADAVSTSLGAIGDVFDFLQNFRPEYEDIKNSEGDVTGQKQIPIITSVANLRGLARQLANAALIIAEEFYEATKGWDTLKNDAITSAAEAISAAIGAISDILDLIQELQELSEGGKKRSDGQSKNIPSPFGSNTPGKSGLDTSGLEAIIDQIIGIGVAIAEQVEPIEVGTTDIAGSLTKLSTIGTLAIQDMADETTDILETWVDNATPLGEDYINGLIQGLHNREGALYAAIERIIRTAIAKVKAAAGIASPSKPMFEMGKNITNSLALGIAAQNNVEKALNTVILDAMRLAKDANSAVSLIAESLDSPVRNATFSPAAQEHGNFGGRSETQIITLNNEVSIDSERVASATSKHWIPPGVSGMVASDG